MRIVVALLGLVALSAAYPNPTYENWDIWTVDTPDNELNGIDTFVRVCTVTLPDGTIATGCCDGWTGTVGEGCLTPVCTTACANGGDCVSPDTCQCLSGFTGPTCQDVAKGYVWTDWLSRDNYGTGGDDERLHMLREQHQVCEGVVPSAVECRTTSGIPYDQSGQVVTCDRRLGLVCEHDDQPNREDCLNYEVRMLCPDSKKVTTKTCTFNQLEYDVDETRKESNCIECTCGNDGEWDCHQVDPNCGIPLKPTVSPFPKTFNLAEVPTGGKCYFNDKEYQPSENAELDCEICTCDAVNGWQCNPKPACTYSPQTPKCKVEKHFIFFHGHTAKKGCNTCVCNSGNWDCTKMICPEPMTSQYEKLCYKPEASYDRPVKEGTVAAKDCNTCVCTRGKWDCTQHTCQSQPVAQPKKCIDVDNKPYPHGTTVTRDCNACTCQDGIFDCTHRYCSPNFYHNSTCVDQKSGSILQTGQTIKKGCNVCVCNSGNLTCTESQCARTNMCFDERNRFDVTNHVIGVQYRPQCNQDGTFAAAQCNVFTEICFCVTPVGRVIPGSRVYKKTPDCSLYTAFPQVIPDINSLPDPQLPQLQTTGEFPKCTDYPSVTSDIPDYFQPKCLVDGSFSPIQCNPNTGFCYCVSSKGATIPGTYMHVTEGVPTCEKFRDAASIIMAPTLSLCQERKQVAEIFKLPFIPECDANTGEYEPRQCNLKNGQCVCVDKNGMVIKDSFREKNVPSICDQYRNYVLPGDDGIIPFTVPRVNSQSEYQQVDFTVKIKTLFKETTSKCQRQLRIAGTIKTVFTPQCETDGAYAPLQCPVDTGICFCVDMTGAVVSDTAKVSTSVPQPSCEIYRNVVLAPHNLTRTSEHTTITDGIKVGVQVTKPSTPFPNKNITVPSCIRQQQIATVVPGVFYPTCQKNGTFHPQQCHAISNKCFCVDRNGVPIEGTESQISQGLPQCDQFWNVIQKLSGQHVIPVVVQNAPVDDGIQQRSVTVTPPGTRVDSNCTKQVELASLLPGLPIPTCEPDGTYTPLQCNATSGVCFCSESDGIVVPETVTPIILGTPSCWHLRNITIGTEILPHIPEEAPLRYAACKNKQRVFNETDEYDQFFLTYPACRKDGSFEPVQCNILRGHCFCVHPITGDKFEHTESTSVPDCSFFEQNSCEWKGEKYYLGEQYYQDCNHCTCSGNNLSTCTRMGCDPTKCYANGMAFSHGDFAKKDCNDCTCEHGEWSCTTDVCPPENTPIVHPTQPTFDKGCLRNGIYYQKDENFCDRCQECTCVGGDWASCTQAQCLSFLCYHDCQSYYHGDEIVINNLLHHCDNTKGEFVKVECEADNGQILQLGETYYKVCNLCTCREGGEFECEQNQC